MKTDELNHLIDKYLSGKATEEESRKIEEWYKSFENEEIKEDLSIEERRKRGWILVKGRMEDPFEEGGGGRRKEVLYKWLKVAAVFIVLISTGYFLKEKMGDKKFSDADTVSQEVDLQPGAQKAILILGDGEEVDLNSRDTGLISQQGKMLVKHTGGDQLSYESGGADGHEEGEEKLVYNMIRTPKGGKYKVTLSDGTEVWLNSNSSLYFPTSFSKEKREVRMTGEIYFEVAKDPARPFIVKREGMQVQVLGTKFNVMAYENEQKVEVSLLEGSVEVNKEEDKKKVKINPGEQAQILDGEEIRVRKGIGLDHMIAWKDNLFWFENSHIEEIVRKLERWYDVDIQIEGSIPDEFTGSIPMDLPFSEVIALLRETGRLNYKIIDDGKVIFTS